MANEHPASQYPNWLSKYPNGPAGFNDRYQAAKKSDNGCGRVVKRWLKRYSILGEMSSQTPVVFAQTSNQQKKR